MKDIALFGSTGLIGSKLLEYLLEDDSVEKIHLALRNNIAVNSPKIINHLINFEDINEYNDVMRNCDTVFVAVGTTQRKVKGDKILYRKVDYDIPVFAGLGAIKENVQTLVFVSSVGADSNSGNFYLRIKGEVEDKLKSLSFRSLHIMQPSMLLGERMEFRLGERIGQVIMQMFSFLIPQLYKPIEARIVAKTMYLAAKENKNGIHTYTYKNFNHE